MTVCVCVGGGGIQQKIEVCDGWSRVGGAQGLMAGSRVLWDGAFRGRGSGGPARHRRAW
jgi:hypothetical protein